MRLTGKVEEKKGNLATILVTKALPCGDNCRNCSAGCKHFSLHVQTEVDNDINEGDIVNVKQKHDTIQNNGFMRYAIPAVLIICSVIIIQSLSPNQNKSAASALAVLVSIIASHYITKLYNKLQMKNNSKNYIITKTEYAHKKSI